MEETKQYEQKLYILVPYNISTMQNGAQSVHAALEYADLYGHTDEYRHYIGQCKTVIILDGGTTNSTRDVHTNERIGSLDRIAETLEDMDIKHTTFYEPDLNNALTGVCFLADERVWDWKNYPRYKDWAFGKYGEAYTVIGADTGNYDDLYVEYRKTPHGQISEEDVKLEYENFVGGKENIVLKDIIYGKKLAT